MRSGRLGIASMFTNHACQIQWTDRNATRVDLGLRSIDIYLIPTAIVPVTKAATVRMPVPVGHFLYDQLMCPDASQKRAAWKPSSTATSYVLDFGSECCNAEYVS